MRTVRPATQLFSNRRSMAQMLRSVLTGCYRMSVVTTVVTFAVLAYIVSPFDLFPDFSSPYGFVEDALLLILLIKVWSNETHRYVRFKVMERKQRGC
ncbi:MAG: DUF1232 domain-containing protein [Flavipsychrobacter sp.]|nr:DUF1232 domain-containing protein [Flavipsychrobacter sp.]